MGCVDPTNYSDAHLPAGCLAACMVAAGIRPEDDSLLHALVSSYRSFALKSIMVRTPSRASLTLLPPLMCAVRAVQSTAVPGICCCRMH